MDEPIDTDKELARIANQIADLIVDKPKEEDHDYVISIEEKNSQPCSEEDFDLMIHQIREILESHGFKLESFGNVDSAIKFYGGIYLEKIKEVIDECIKNDLSNLSKTTPEHLYYKVTNRVGGTQIVDMKKKEC